MPLTRADALEKFRTWKTNRARVQITLTGVSAAGNQRLLTAQVDGTVQVVEPDGDRALVVVARDNCTMQMYLTDECLFQTMTFGANEPAHIADVESIMRIGFPTGEACYVTFYRQPN